MVELVSLRCPHLPLLLHLPNELGIRLFHLRFKVRAVHFLGVLFEIGEDLGDGGVGEGGAGVVCRDDIHPKR